MPNTKKIILLNGPASCGKDTAARLFLERNPNTFSYKMSRPLKEACHTFLGLNGTLEELEHLKEVPIKFFVKSSYNHWPAMTLVNDHGEMTLRQFYIHMSENVIKPLFGENHFGNLAVENIAASNQDVVTISDSGFEPEAMPIIDRYGADNVCLIRIHRDGTNFKGDSRGYVSLPVSTILDIENNSSFDQFSNTLQAQLKQNFLQD